MTLKTLYITLPLLALTLTARGAQTREAAPEKPLVVMADSTRFGEDFWDDEEQDTVAKTRRDYAREANHFNALDYQLEHRYIPEGETFQPGLLKNLFIDAGVGIERIQPQASNNYEIEPINQFHLTVGTHLNEMNAFRLRFNYGMGYQRIKNEQMYKAGLHLEHLYDLSAYLVGYNSTRLANISSIFGLGIQRSWFRDGESGTSFEGHVGAQVKFYTGPHAYLTFEPYVGLGGDQMDISGKRNWRGYDIFYGANVGVVYYLRNNLTPESRLRLIESRRAHNELSADSVLMSWQQPWVASMGAGIALMSSPNLGMMETLGSEMVLSVGKWLSPVIGIRATASSRTTTWKKRKTAADPSSYHPEYHEDLNNHYQSIRLEAMLNPMGFFESFNWNAPFGFYLVGGAELGQLHKMQSTQLRTYSESYGGGVNLWWQPTPALKIFMEPRFMHSIYRIPYTNVEWQSRFTDNYFSIDFGLAIETRNSWRWYKEGSLEYQRIQDPLWMLTFGLGGGTHLTQSTHTNSEGNSMGFNGMFFTEYHFNREYSVRLGLEYLSLKKSNISNFIDYNMEATDAEYAPVKRYGLWEHRLNILALSASPQVNLNQLISGYQENPLKLHAFAGPTLFYSLKPKSVLSPIERIMENHTVELEEQLNKQICIGAHLGLKLDYRINRHLGAFLTPTLYWLNNLKLEGLNINKLHLLGTLNIGVQYGLFDQ